jgi:hypothetical protein
MLNVTNKALIGKCHGADEMALGRMTRWPFFFAAMERDTGAKIIIRGKGSVKVQIL